MWRRLAILLLLTAVGADVSHQALLQIQALQEPAEVARDAAQRLTRQEEPGNPHCLTDLLAEHEAATVARRDRLTRAQIDSLSVEWSAAIRTAVIPSSAAFRAACDRHATGSPVTLFGRLIPLRI